MLVLLVFEYPTLNGGENSLLTVLRGLMRKGVQFQAVTPDRSQLSAAIASFGIKVHPRILWPSTLVWTKGRS